MSRAPEAGRPPVLAWYRRARTGFIPFLLLLLLGLTVRLLRLDFQPLWWDEGYSVWFATHPLGQMAALTAQDIHPPLYYALLGGWTRLAGAGPVAVRLFSVVAGVAALPLSYLAGRRLFDTRRAGLLAMLLAALNPMLVYYSQEVRMYGLVALFSTGLLLAAWESFRPDRSPAWRPLLAYVLLATLALYTQYYAVFLPVGLTLFALWRWRSVPRALLQWLAAQAAVGLLFLPWLLYAAPKLVPYVSQKVVQDADRPLGPVVYLLRHLATFTGGHLEGALAPYWPVALLILLPVVYGVALLLRRSAGQHAGETPSPTPVPMLLTVLGVSLLLGWLIGLRFPFFPDRGERLLLLALPPFLLLAAGGIESLLAKSRLAGSLSLALWGAVAATSLVAFYTVPRYPGDDYRPLIARTVEQGLPGDTVACVYPWQAGYWRSYGDPAGPEAALLPSPAWDGLDASALDAALARGRVWFPAHLALGGILETQVEGYLTGLTTPFVNEWFGPGTRLSAWSTGGSVVDAGVAPVRYVTSAGPLSLAIMAIDPRPVAAANGVLPLALSWEAEAAPPTLAVSVRLTDDLSLTWAQHDYEGLGSLAPAGQEPDSRPGWYATDRLGLLVPAGTPPGRYWLELVLRAKGDELPLEAAAADGRPGGPSARLAAVEVIPAGIALGTERLPVAERSATALEDGLRFVGFTVAPDPLEPGISRPVNLFWQATTQPASDYVAFVQVLDARGGVAAGWEAPPGAGFSTSQWTPGTLMRTQATLRVPATLADGNYRLIAGLYRPGTGARLRSTGGADYFPLGRLQVRGRSHQMQPPSPESSADATFGDVARIVGYDLVTTPLGPGARLGLTLHWQALRATDRPLTVFVHLVDAEGIVRGYGDSEPGAGAYPTPGWLSGEYLTDLHTVVVAPDFTPGAYRLAIGLYDRSTGQRLPLAGGADELLLPLP